MIEEQSKFTEERHERMLNDLCKLEGNNKCADCSAPNPRWTSYSLGIFLCMRCASLHRKMGTHISKVKSISLDRWSFEDIQSMKEKGGNLRVNQSILSNKASVCLPLALDDDFEMERYVRDKWEKKRFKTQEKKLEINTDKEMLCSTPLTSSVSSSSSSNSSIHSSGGTPSPQYFLSPVSLSSDRINQVNTGCFAGRTSISENNPFKQNTNPFRTTKSYNPFL